MAISLQDQLLKAGLASKQQANKAKAQKRKEKKQKAAPEASPQDNAAQLKEEKAARDRQLNQEREAQRAKKAAEAEVKQLIEQHTVKLPEHAELPYRFADGKQIKTLYVLPEHQNQLARAQLAIVRTEKHYALIPSEIADRIEQRIPNSVIRIQKEEIAEDDPYAAYQVPDDLMW